MRKEMRAVEDEIRRLEEAIANLRIELGAIQRLRATMAGDTPPPPPESPTRRRASNVKPLILDLMAHAGTAGETGARIAEKVRERVPTVAKDTPGSVLSRLKADGALVYDGERYYDVRFAPKSEKETVRAVF